jgi:hypothetical protein
VATTYTIHYHRFTYQVTDTHRNGNAIGNCDAAQESFEFESEFAAYRTSRSRVDFFGEFTLQRQEFQDMAVHRLVMPGSGSHQPQPWLVYTAGPAGAGKSTTMDWMSAHGHFPVSQ